MLKPHEVQLQHPYISVQCAAENIFLPFQVKTLVVAQIELKYHTRVSEQSLISERIRIYGKNLWPVKTVLPEVLVTRMNSSTLEPGFRTSNLVKVRCQLSWISTEQRDMLPHRTLHFLRSLTLLRLQLIQQHSQP